MKVPQLSLERANFQFSGSSKTSPNSLPGLLSDKCGFYQHFPNSGYDHFLFC